MTITFETESDVIVYALEKIISFARESQYLFVANCAWWIASIIGLEQGLIIHIDNLTKRRHPESFEERSDNIHTDRNSQVTSERAVSATPRDLTEDQRRDHKQSIRKPNRINPLPQTKNQLKKARKVKRLQEENRKKDVERNTRLRKIRATVIENLSKE
jgi:hypothetical protein